MVLEEPLLVGRQVPVLVKRDLACFQIQETVYLIQHHLQFRLGLRPQISRQVQHLWDCRALEEGCLMLEVL